MIARKKFIANISVILLVIATVFFMGCGNNDTMATYSITVTNMTGNQPLSPLAVVIHKAGYSGWKLGMASSHGLEQLAEGGDPSPFVSEAESNGSVIATAMGGAPTGPGDSSTETVRVKHSGDLMLTVTTMLVNTNDAFTGVSDLSIGGMRKNERVDFSVSAYDAGTEVNSEVAATIPGPAGGGEGYNSERTDHNFISVHSGVVTDSDGLASSALNESHRFLNPVAKVVIIKTE